MDVGIALVLLFGLVALLVFFSLSFTALFRPDHLPTLIEAYRVIALALVGKRYSERKVTPTDDHKPPHDSA